MERILVDLKDKSYDILIGGNTLGQITDYIEGYQKIMVLSNTTVGALYSEKLLDILEMEGKEVFYFEVNDGEEHKNIDSAFGIYDYMLENDFDRKSLIITLGGGVICDLGGYIASTYMRGIDFIQVPTSLLAQVDASVGGKVAVNHSKAKNLIGTFHQPKLVLVDTEFLHTLPVKEIKAGMGEVIKHSFLRDNGYYEYLEANSDDVKALESHVMTEVVKRSCLVKKEIVEADEREQGQRALLNLGHTWGHALETATNYRGYSHGEGVAKGIIFEMMISERLGYIERDYLERGRSIFERYDIDCKPLKMEENRLIELMKKDKKNTGGRIKFILPKGMGVNVIEDVPEALIKEINAGIEDRYIRGVIDLGTNSCRLFTAEVEEKNNTRAIVRKYEKYLEICRLGEDVDKNGYLLPEAIERTVKVLKEYREKLNKYGATEVVVYATSATRDSANRDEFIDLVKKEAGLVIECITGEREAKLSFSGAIEGIEDRVVLIDIGGGSTEVVKGDRESIEFMKSFDVGAVRVTEKFFSNGKYTEDGIEAANLWIEEVIGEIKEFSEEELILTGVAGTVTTHVSVAEKMRRYDSERVHHYLLTREQIVENLKLFLSVNLEERKKIKGLHEKRANVIIGGSLVLLTIMKVLKRSEILVSEDDILEGMMEEE